MNMKTMKAENDEEIPWIEDADNDLDGDETEADEGPMNLFSASRRPNEVYSLKFSEKSEKFSVSVELYGIKSARFPHLLPSTGLTLWKSSEWLCQYLCDNSHLIVGKSVVELGAGLGLCGIAAYLLGARDVILTDGDTDTLAGMRRNVSLNGGGDAGGNQHHPQSSIHCRQLLWGHSVNVFKEKWAPGGFDVVMGSDIFYAQESMIVLIETILQLMKPQSGIFILSFADRSGVRIDEVLELAAKKGLEWSTIPTQMKTEKREGVYVFTPKR